tara:strand:- start:524 stop:1225 length:702 start_codon:yes stop_codon:yes gene_type:complete
MKFFKRLKYFAVGFSIGIIFVYFLFNSREFKWDWLPGNRVTNFIINHPIKINTEAYRLVSNKEKLSNDFFNTILNGKVDFSKSETKGNIKYYAVNHLDNSAFICISFVDSFSQLAIFNDNIFSEKIYLNKNDSNLNMDDLTFINFISKKKKKLNNNFLDQLKKYNISERDFNNSFNSIRVLWELSRPYEKPYGSYTVYLEINETKYHVIFDYGNEKLRFKEIKNVTKQSKLST